MNELTANQKMELLLSYASKIAQTKELDVLLFDIATMGKMLIGVDRCTVWLLDEKRDILWTKVAHGIPTIEIPSNTGVVGESIRTASVVFSNNPYELPFFNADVDKNTGYKTNSLLTTPLFNDMGEVIGAFQCVNKLTGDCKFNQEDVGLLKLVSTYAQKALVTAMLAIEIEKTQIEIILLMSEIAESRSKETGNHVKRVAKVSAELARLAGLKADDIKLLEVASPMHDIGKVAIPDSILNKPDKLTEEEYEIIKTHAEIGYNLLKNSHRPIIKAAAIVAREHHEKWNGKGYPRGIEGDDIHIFGRITAIADVFDALSCERCYKKAWEMPRIIEHFKSERGEHFDPILVDHFLRNIDTFTAILDKYKD
ncbi:MAG: HD domain-containing protein [Bacillota bacterium]|nr:HD domain-containing protein [Bacillota bacterium]